MLSININNNFSENTKPEETSVKEGMNNLENIFALMLSAIEDQEDNLVSLTGDTNSGNDVKLTHELDFQETKNQLGNSLLAFYKKGDISSDDLLKLYESYKNFLNIKEANDQKFSLKFTLENLKNDDTFSLNAEKVSEELKVPTNNQGSFDTKLNRTGEVLVKNLNNFPANTNVTEDLETIKTKQQTLNPEILKSYSKESSKNRDLKDSNEKNNFLSDTSGSYLSKNFVKTSALNQTFGTFTQLKLETNPSEEKTELKIDKIDGNDTQALNEKNSNGNKTLSQRSHILNHSNQVEAQLRMLEKNWGTNLARIVENAIKEGREKIEIQLDPKKLGRLNVSLSINNNQTTIVVNTENTAAALLLTGAEERLSQMFEASGLKLSNFQANSNNNNKGNTENEKNDQNKNNKVKISSQKEKELAETSIKNLNQDKIDNQINLIA